MLHPKRVADVLDSRFARGVEHARGRHRRVTAPRPPAFKPKRVLVCPDPDLGGVCDGFDDCGTVVGVVVLRVVDRRTVNVPGVRRHSVDLFAPYGSVRVRAEFVRVAEQEQIASLHPKRGREVARVGQQAQAQAQS